MKTILITGANRGIGLELARQYAHAGEDVIAVCRNSSPALDAISAEIIDEVDVSEERGIRRLRDAVGKRTIDILVNNAAVFLSDAFPDLDAAGLRRHLDVNTIAPILVTQALLDRMAPDGKVILITSRIGSMADNDSGGYYGYRISKAALNMAGVNMAKDLQPRGIALGLLHPGFVRTDMTSGQGNLSPEESAGQLIERIAEVTLDTTGSFRHANGTPLPW